MAKYIDADCLKAEIEKNTPNTLQLLVYRDIILALIDSLQQKQPEVDLEEAAEEYASDGSIGFIDMTAYNAFIAGAKWQARQLLKGSPLPEDTVLFQKGVEEGKRLMMEDAVEVAVEGYIGGDGVYVFVDLPTRIKVDEGDVVKVIIVKK